MQQIVCRVCAGGPFFIMQQSFVARFVDIGGQGGVEFRHFQLEAVTVMGGVEGVAEVEIFFFEQPVRGSRIVAPLGSHVSPVTRHQETALVAAAVIVEHEAVAVVDVVFQAGVGVEERIFYLPVARVQPFAVKQVHIGGAERHGQHSLFTDRRAQRAL